jgi:hypothetical protein
MKLLNNQQTATPASHSHVIACSCNVNCLTNTQYEVMYGNVIQTTAVSLLVTQSVHHTSQKTSHPYQLNPQLTASSFSASQKFPESLRTHMIITVFTTGVTSFPHLNLLHLVSLTISGEQNKQRTSSLYNLLHPPVNPTPLRPNNSLTTAFSLTARHCNVSGYWPLYNHTTVLL